MKKISIFVLSILIIICISSVSFAFTDIQNHWAKDTIKMMFEKKIVNGYTDNSFKPDNSMTRAEFVTVINKLLGLKEESSKYIPDITRQDWFYEQIRIAVQAGMIQGNESGYVRPNDEITREEAIVILTRAFKIKSVASFESKYADESEIADWAKETVISFIKYGYINGYSDNTIKPKNSITRAEVLVIINRIIANILNSNIYEGVISGNTLIHDANVTLNKLIVSGNLIISNEAMNTLKINDVVVKGDLIILEEPNKSIKSIKVEGDIYNLYELQSIEDEQYVNLEYGIKFAMPKSVTVKELKKDDKINYKEKDLIVIDIKTDDEYYLKSINTIAKSEVKKYANLFKLIESGKINTSEYMLYDDNDKAQMMVIKRGNIVYTLIFFNIESENFVENVVSTMELIETENIKNITNVIYKNSKLSLKFTYKDTYVVVDDSYNTNQINESDGFFKLFIQVNTITDIQNYNINEIKGLLTSLVESDGEILETKTLKIVNNDSIKFKIKNEEKIIYSLYVIVGNNLYNFIFTGEENAMNEVGESLFNDIINTLEF